MATLYFKEITESGVADWHDLDNWWQDDQFTVQATALPTSSDTVNLSGVITSMSGGNATVFGITSAYFGFNLDAPRSITVTNTFVSNEVGGGYGGERVTINYTGTTPISLTSLGGPLTLNASVVVSVSSIYQNHVTINAPVELTTGTLSVGVDGAAGTFTANITLRGDAVLVVGDATMVGTVNLYDESSISAPFSSSGSMGTVRLYDDSFMEASDYLIYCGSVEFNDDSYNLGCALDGGPVTWNGFTGTNASGTFKNGSMVLHYAPSEEGGDWDTESSWWKDDEAAAPAGRIPRTCDSVFSGIALYTENKTVVYLTIGVTASFGGSVTVAGGAAFLDGSSLYTGSTIYGNASFIGSYNGGTVIGDAVFDGGVNQTENGYVSGNATFINGSINQGGGGGIVTGDAVFTDTSYNEGSIEGDATFYGESYNGGWSGTNGYVGGNAVFYDNSHNGVSEGGGYVDGNAAFHDNSYQLNSNAEIAGTATMYGSSYNEVNIGGGVIVSYARGINGSSILGVI